MIGEAKLRIFNIQGGQQIIIERLLVILAHADGYRNVRPQARVEPDIPAAFPVCGLEAAADHNGDIDLPVDKDKVGGHFLMHGTAQILYPANGVFNHAWVDFPQTSINFDITVIPLRRVINELIGTDQAPEAAGLSAARWHIVTFINQDAGEPAFALVEFFQLGE